MPDTLEAMAPLYAAVAHGCPAGKHQEALVEVYGSASSEGTSISLEKLGAFGADLTALAGLFNPAWHRPVKGLTEGDKAFLLNEVGYDLQALGRLAEAAEPMQNQLTALYCAERMEGGNHPSWQR